MLIVYSYINFQKLINNVYVHTVHFIFIYEIINIIIILHSIIISVNTHILKKKKNIKRNLIFYYSY